MGKLLRIIAIILMGLTAVMNLLGGAGTSCAAFSSNPEYISAFQELMDYRWVYQALVVTTVLIGIAGVWMTVRLVRGGGNMYRDTLIVLVVGTVLAGVHFYASTALRGKAAPANMKFYINVITLIVFLLLGLPGIREKVDFSRSGGKGEAAAAAGMAALLAGIVTLTVFGWAGPTHTFGGENWVYVFYTPLMIGGVVLTAGGLAALGWGLRELLSGEAGKASLPVMEKQPLS